MTEHPRPSPLEVEKVKAWEGECEAFDQELRGDRARTYACPTCHDTAWVLGGSGSPIPCPSCGKFDPTEALRKYANIPDRRSRDKFKTFNLKEAPLMKESYDAALEFATGYNEVPWLLLAGPTGCGKTHLGYAAANEMALKGWKLKMWVVADLLDAIRASFHQRDSDPSLNTQKLIEEMAYEPDILILDDLGGEKATDWAAEELFQIIDRRYREGRPLMVTTNEDIDRLPDRIRSRFTDGQICKIVVTDSPDFRPQMLTPQHRRDKKPSR